MPTLLNFQEFCEDLKEITTTKIVDKRKFHADGLFSEQIFGPIKNYTCQCGTYYGLSGSGGTCAICGVDVVNSNERRRRFGKIILPTPVINPLFYDLVTDLSGTHVKDAINKLSRDETTVLYWNEADEEFSITTQEGIPDGVESWEGLEAVHKIVSTIADMAVEDGEDDWKLVKDNIDQLIINQIIVLPPDLRPASKGVARNDQVVDKINRFYMQLLTKKESMSDTFVEITTDRSLFFNYYRQIQKDVNELYSHILEKLSKKEGLIRGNILGKRIDFSGRAVIVPAPTLSLDECSLPYGMFLELFKLQIAQKLIRLGKYKQLDKAINFVDECIELNIPVLFRICEELAEGQVCLLNRQPSLHRLSMLGYYVKVSLDSVIKIHPLSCPPFNADFDGDQMAVYIPSSEAAKQEIIDKLLITNNLKNPANESLSTTPSQDMVLGVYALTNNTFTYLQDEHEYKGKTLTQDKIIFNDCFPEDYPVIEGSVGSKRLVKILNDVVNKYPQQEVALVLDNIKFMGFKYSTLFGPTLSLDNCYIPGVDEVNNSIYDHGTVREQLNLVSSPDIENFLKESFPYSYMIESGARGSWDQVRQIVLTRGFISNFRGQIISEPIKNSFIHGLTPKEFFNSTYGSRKGLLDVALNTGTSGYLSRKLIFTCANLQIGDELDCGTEDLLKVYVDDEKKARMLIGKWMVDAGEEIVISDENYKDIIGNTIRVRSPIYCKSSRICHKCYGEVWKTLNTRFVGIIAAQSLGECNTQLVLRTFHTSGVAVINDDGSETDSSMKQQDIVADLSTVSKLLHRFNKGSNPETLVDKLYVSYNHSRTIHHVHFECVVSQLMWHGIYKWRLLANRSAIVPEFHSVQTVPSYESWLMGLAFSNPKKHIIKGIIHPGMYKGIIDKILCGEKM